jgi:PAS domain S-box-containing protein
MPNTTPTDAGAIDQQVNVLLVDDQPASLQAVAAILADLGMNVIKAGSGEEALRWLQSETCAVILLDVQMPGLDGFETAKRIRATDRPRYTPILFLSDEDGGELAIKAYQLGAVDFLVKPLVPDVLRAKVTALVQLFQQAQTANRQNEQLRLLIEGAEENARRLLQEQAARQAAQHAERAERRQREQLHVTLTSIGDGVIITDTNGIVNFLNPVAQALTGWAPEEAAGQPLERIFRILNEETRHTVENPVTKALRDDTIVGLANHTLLIARDGTERPIDDSAAPIRGEDGTIAGVVLVFRDVTEARQALEARLRLAAIVEFSDDAIISKNLDGIIVSWNQGAERLYGYTALEMIGQPLSILVPRDHPDELPALMERLKRGERIDHFETVRMRKDRSRVDVSLTISPVKNAEGKVIGASKVARDITASKRKAEAARFLADASSLLAELMDVPSTLQKVARLAVPYFADWCAVDLLEPDGSLRCLAVAHVNPAKVKLAHELHRRYPPDRKAPYGVWHILRTGQSELVAEITDTMLRDSIQDEERLRIVRELGLKSYMGVPLRVRGKMLGVLTFIAAESGRKYDAADLTVAEDLAERASIAIENARLYGELREADRHKDEFLAMLAHELRNPLAPIRNSLHILKQAAASPEMVGRVRDIAERQVQHMARLLEDLLDVARISRGRIALRQEVVDMASVVQRTVETARPLLEERRHQLTVALPPEPVRVRGDAARLEQVLTNLLNNSAKYTDPGGRIGLTVEREGGEVVLRVRDSGIGIAPEMLPRIFELFVQAERRLDRSQGGVGIGLTLVKKLVELHGGAIQAFSAGLGQGSEFVVRLPAFSGEKGSETGHGPEGERVRTPPPCQRVLVVDDNVDAADSLALLLRLEGQDVQVAHDGFAALEMARAFRPVIVFLDIGMPGMDGYEVCRRLRQQSGEDSLLIVALTGWGQEEDRRRSQEAGFDLHFIKPVEPDALHKILEHPGSARRQIR